MIRELRSPWRWVDRMLWKPWWMQGWSHGDFDVVAAARFTPRKFSSLPLKIGLLPKGNSSSNHHFSGAMLNFGGVSRY